MINRQTEAILVTGGRGFIGRQLVQLLMELQRALVLSADVVPVVPGKDDLRRVELHVDVRSRDKLSDIFSRFQITTVFDLASITEVMLPKSEYAPNLDMTRSMVDCALRFNVEKYVFFST